MKKGVLIGIVILAVIILLLFGFNKSIVGRAIANNADGGPDSFVPNNEGVACMKSCVAVGCEAGDSACMTANSVECGKKCGVETEPPKPADEGEECMQKCVVVGCDDYDFSCQKGNKDSCDDKCGMKGDAPDESEMDEEQKCISDCVAEEDPTLICGNSQEGETGNNICQKCAADCVYLYEGPCLNDEEITQKEEECNTCEHCYGDIIMSDSGQGWDCIIDVECADSSSEFGDDAGTGDASYEKGHESPGVIGQALSGIGNFLKGLFERSKETKE